ncbi:hypothetical protein [Micromonospora nigra]|uniref:hypothetical protein n=1 Tax=Micromonospora nigra TaxID=145857 RepID=UPI001FDF46AE|nr:hypothetical protein [Micromonospora nigra]
MSRAGGVEAFADERCGADDKETVAGLGAVEPVDDGPPFAAAHRAWEHERLVPACGEQSGECLDLGDPAGQDETVATAGQGRGDIVGDLCVAGLVEGQPSVYLASAPGASRSTSPG